MEAAELLRLRAGPLSSFMPRRRLCTRPVIANARARSFGSLIEGMGKWPRYGLRGSIYQCADALPQETKTYRNVLAGVVCGELTGELVDNVLAGEDVEQMGSASSWWSWAAQSASRSLGKSKRVADDEAACEWKVSKRRILPRQAQRRAYEFWMSSEGHTTSRALEEAR